MPELKLPINAIRVLERRYPLKDDARNIIETPFQLFRRVSSHVAKAEDNFKDKAHKRQEVEDKFFKMMHDLEFMPNSPTLMNAGTKMGQLSACFVLPVRDSIPDIFKALKDMATIHQTGGGTGFDFSSLRPKGDLVYSTKGEASGADEAPIWGFYALTILISRSLSRQNYKKAVLPISIFLSR